MGYNKFGRNYILTLSGPSLPTPLVITLPFTMEFDIIRNSYASTNSAKIRIFNLSKEHRSQIVHDQFDYSPAHLLNIKLQAGYGISSQYPLIFTGNATRAFSVRQGVDFITEINAFDGGDAYANAVSKRTFTANTSIATVYNTLISDLLPFGVSAGVVSQQLGSLARGGSFSGSTVELLAELSNNNFFIDNLKANILNATDAIGGNNIEISSASGLLGTPIKEQQYLLFDVLFEPRVAVGTQINLQSSTGLTSYNGLHKVVSVQHKGVISAAVAGDAITSLGVSAGVFNVITAQVGL